MTKGSERSHTGALQGGDSFCHWMRGGIAEGHIDRFTEDGVVGVVDGTACVLNSEESEVLVAQFVPVPVALEADEECATVSDE